MHTYFLLLILSFMLLMYWAVDTDLPGEMKTSNLQHTWQIHTIRLFVLHVTIPKNYKVLTFFLLFIMEDILRTFKKISRRWVLSKEAKSQKKLDFVLYCASINPCFNENHRRNIVATKSFLFQDQPLFSWDTIFLLWHFFSSRNSIFYILFSRWSWKLLITF